MSDIVERLEHPNLDDDHKSIWLAPRCEEERTWCQDSRGGCDECGSPEVEYIRADLVEAERKVSADLIESLRRERDEANQLARFWEADAARQTVLLGKAEKLVPLVDEMLAALQSYGFPVSDVAERALFDSGSVEAQRVHSAAAGLRRVCRTALGDGTWSSGLRNQKGVKKGTTGGQRDALTKAAGKARSRAKAKPKQRPPRLAAFSRLPSELSLPPDAAPARGDVWLALPGSSPVAVAEHRENCCRWPVGLDLPFLFCNEAVADGKVYCTAHAAVAYREPPPRKDNGRRDSR